MKRVKLAIWTKVKSASAFKNLYQSNLTSSLLFALFLSHNNIPYKDKNTQPSQYACHRSALWYEVHVNRLRVGPRWHCYACCHLISLSFLFLVLLEHRSVVKSHWDLILPDPCLSFLCYWSWLVIVSEGFYLYLMRRYSVPPYRIECLNTSCAFLIWPYGNLWIWGHSSSSGLIF